MKLFQKTYVPKTLSPQKCIQFPGHFLSDFFLLMVEWVPVFSGTRLFWGYPKPIFPGWVCTRPEADLMKQNIEFGVKKYVMMPDKIPEFFLCTYPNPTFWNSDPNPTFYYPIYSIPDFFLPAPPLHTSYNN